MAWGPITPAHIAFDAQGLPHAPEFGDLYHARAGALAQARHVFLAGNGLPERWRGRERFVVLETGFGLGHNFLATWAAWRADPARCKQLHYVSLDKHPPRRDDLAQALAPHARDADIGPLAQALLDAWPAPTPDLHLIDLEPGRVRLLLGFGDVAAVLPELVLQADALFLDGFAPARNPAMWDAPVLCALGRLAAADARAATWSVAGPVREGLHRAGFVVQKAPGFGRKREMAQARHAPHPHAHPQQRLPPPGRRGQPGVRRVCVLGAGLAGAAAAHALAAQGLEVTVLEAGDAAAQGASGNPGGLLHGTVHAQDGPHARWLRAAALHAQRVLAAAVQQGTVPGQLTGLWRGEALRDPAAMQALLDAQALPPAYARVGRDACGRPAWFYPGAGWVSPTAVVSHWLGTPGIRLRTSCRVHTLRRLGDGWQLEDAAGTVLEAADAVVLANAEDAMRLLAGLGLPAWPTGRRRGQTTVLPAGLPGMPAMAQPLAAGGYALQLPDGRLLCGASNQAGDDDAGLRPSDHADNLAKLARLTGWTAPLAADDPRLDGRVGWRFVTDDRLPLVGPVPQPGARPQVQVRQVPRIPGLWLLSALGSRGLTQAALAGELLAAWLTESPWPVPASLAEALDPARFAVRAARRAAG